MMRRAAAAVLTAIALLSACSALQAPEPDRSNTYLLEPAVLTTAASARTRPQREPVLAVSSTRARPGFDTALMAYTQRPNTIEYFANNRWIDTPARMLTPLLAQAIERSGVFRGVVQAPSGVIAGLRLDTELVRLQQDFSAGPSVVRITLRAQLIDTATRRVLASTELDEVEAATTDDPYGGVIAANRALARLLARIVDFCAEAPAAR